MQRRVARSAMLLEGMKPARGLLFAGLLCLTGCLSPQAREAADLLSDIAAGQASSSLKQPAMLTRTAIVYRRSGSETADLYQGGTPPRGGVVVFPGLTPY